MRCLQGSFPRIKDKFRYEEKGERKLILQMIVLLYNFRASKVGQNQIASVYMPYLHTSRMQIDMPCNSKKLFLHDYLAPLLSHYIRMN